MTVGKEVAITASEKMQWAEVKVQSSRFPVPEGSFAPSGCLPRRAASGCHVISSSNYLSWRLHEEHPNVMDIVKCYDSNEFTRSGLRLVFQDILCPITFLFEREDTKKEEFVHLLYVLTVSGVALLCNLRSSVSYASGSTLPQKDIVEIDLRTHTQGAMVTAVKLKSGCLVISWQDGSICCYNLVQLAHSSTGGSELHDHAVVGRLWTVMSRTKHVGPVQDIETATVTEREMLFVLHLDGNLCIWDISGHTELLNCNVCSNDFEGHPSRLWVGEANQNQNLISLAVLQQGTMIPDHDGVTLYGFSFGTTAGKSTLSPEPSIFAIPLLEGKLADLKISTDKICILKEVGSMLYEIRLYDSDTRNMTDIQQLLLLPPSEDDGWNDSSTSTAAAQVQEISQWETLKLYAEKYKDVHPRLPVTVAEALIYTDPEIEIPSWLIQMFKTTNAGSSKPCHGNGDGVISGRYGQSGDDWASEWEDEDISSSDADEEGDDDLIEPRPERIAAGGYAMAGDFHEKIFLKCMWCHKEIADRYRTCCDKFYCRKCAMSCCLHSANATYLLYLPEMRRILSQDMVVPVPLPPPEFPYFIHEGKNSLMEQLLNEEEEEEVNRQPLITHTFINWHDVKDRKKNVRAVEYHYNFDEEGNQIGCATFIMDMRVVGG